jgi:Uma2 family endonuclease
VLLERLVASSTTKLLTFAEVTKLPEPEGLSYYELHNGEVVQLTRPALNHMYIQKRLQTLLDSASAAGSAFVEVGLRMLNEYEYRIADVAWSPREHWARMDPAGQFMGVPELVIEVLSPSNTASEMLDKKQICLENGAVEFWVVNPIHQQVEVTSREGRTGMYRAGQQIPLFFGGSIAVDSIFA